MKSIIALVILAASAFAAPAPEANADMPLSLEHLQRRDSVSCNSSGSSFDSMACTGSVSSSDIIPACRANCSAEVDFMNCVSKANPSRNAKLPLHDLVPDLNNLTNNTMSNATIDCYKTLYCPKLDEITACVQCVLDNGVLSEKMSKEGIEQAVTASNTRYSRYPDYCDRIGAKAANYTPLKYNNAKTAAATSSLLLALGVAAASLL